MSDNPPEAAPEATTPAPPKVKTSKAVLLMLALNLGGTGFGVFKVMTASAAAAHAEDKKPAEDKTQEVTGPIVPLDPFVTNLDEPGNARYLKVTIQLELVSPESQERLEKSKQVIRDAILSHLSGLKLKDTLGAEAKETMRKAIMTKLEAILGADKVRRIFFQEFVVQ